jgi:uncharacterized repeat protein (TIGR03803 family)
MITTEQRDRGYKRVRLAASAALAFGIVLLPLMAAQPARAQTTPYTILYTFTGGADGGYPRAPLIADKAGNLYGTAVQGGLVNCIVYGAAGCGVVFKMDPTGNETVLYSFTGGADGAIPSGGLVLDQSGNLYGTTADGGLDGNCYDNPTCGTVFKLDPQGNETVLYSFTGGADGENPFAGVIRDAAGNLYGTTIAAGAYDSGTVFKIDSTGVFSVLYTFTGGADGESPNAGVIRDAAGNLYGTAAGGGYRHGGVVFKLDPAGNETVLHAFTGRPDGLTPTGGVVQDAAGNLYGTTSRGGATNNGTVFEVDTAGNETVLRSFLYTKKGGAWPEAGVVLDASGNLYGTTPYTECEHDGNTGSGTVFRVNPTGKETVVHVFSGTDGATPYANLLLYKGILYGTTFYGGSNNVGVVFKVGR